MKNPEEVASAENKKVGVKNFILSCIVFVDPITR